jgi:hypothetical protein
MINMQGFVSELQNLHIYILRIYYYLDKLPRIIPAMKYEKHPPETMVQ